MKIAKRTPLYSEHVRLGARIVEFSNWEMPVMYTNVIDEHITTRTKAGIFDICHMGEFLIEGKDSVKFLQKILARDISQLKEGKCFYTVMCNEHGGTIDDLFIYKFSDNRFMIVVNAGTIEKDFKHMIANKENFDIMIKNISDEIAKLDIQGPNSEKIMQQLAKEDLSIIKRFDFKEIIFADTDIIISRTGYTAEDGFELYFDKNKAVEIWSTILEKGKRFGIKPIGLGARDTLRLEACYSLYGHELNDIIGPFEADIGYTVSPEKEDFIGKKALIGIKSALKSIKVAFELLEKGIPREHYKVLKNNKEIGYVTSGTMSPTFKKGIGMALIDTQYSKTGTEIDINIRDKLYKAKVMEKPFYSYKGKIWGDKQ